MSKKHTTRPEVLKEMMQLAQQQHKAASMTLSRAILNLADGLAGIHQCIHAGYILGYETTEALKELSALLAYVALDSESRADD